jgi:hypothetical protein
LIGQIHNEWTGPLWVWDCTQANAGHNSFDLPKRK